MNILVTVGTSAFDELIEAVDKQLLQSEYSLTCQIADGRYIPKNHLSIKFSNDFTSLVNNADIVIAHGGAATVFELLEGAKKIVLVPNAKRIDKHQHDLAGFVQKQNYGVVCWSLETLLESVRFAQQQTFAPYHKEPFFMARNILQYFNLVS
jgi:beta-1,4-N-acetylglucosaminyltransferase